MLFFIFIYNYFQKNKKSRSIHSINDQLVITAEEISNKNIDSLIDALNKNGVNVEVQSLNKTDNKTIIVLKLSDFDLDKLSLVEEYFKSNKISTKEIQFYSSTE